MHTILVINRGLTVESELGVHFKKLLIIAEGVSQGPFALASFER